MRNILFFIIITFVAVFHAYAQSDIESQLRSFKEALKDKNLSRLERVDNLIALADYYMGTPGDTALNYLQEAKQLSLAAKDSFNLMRSYNRIALLEIYNEEDEVALKYTDSALLYANYNKNSHFAGIGYSYRIKGMAFNYLEKKNKALESFLRANRYLIKPEQDNELKTYLAENYSDLASIYLSTDNKEIALECIEKSLSIAKPIEAWWEVAGAYEFLSNYYLEKNEYTVSKKYLDSATIMYSKISSDVDLSNVNKLKANVFLKEGQFDEAIDIYKLEIVQDKESSQPYTLTEDYLFLSDAYAKKGLLNVAKEYLDSTIISATESDNPAHEIRIGKQQATLYKAKEEYARAIFELREILNKSYISEYRESKKEIYEELYNLFELNNDPKSALFYYKNKQELADSLKDILQQNKYGVLQSEFNYNELESKLETRNAQLKLTRAEQKQQNDRGMFFIGLFGLVALFFIFSFFRQRKLNKIKRETLLAKQEVLKIKKQALDTEVEFKNKQITDFAIHISEKNELLENIKKKLKSVRVVNDSHKGTLMDTMQFINNDIEHNKEKIQLYKQIEQTNDSFRAKLEEKYENLNDKEQKVATMLRLGQTSKQIALQLGISAASVDNYRYSLRKKMGVPKGESLKKFIKNV
ncbi:MAG: tetratricopeptide repeat protein [Patiriisocius sp.]|uniref:tetratricopeptide repeat protein n=1 Tax=Patiriisocius sp. TaxID=2822396 RepID=UPI003EF48EFF